MAQTRSKSKVKLYDTTLRDGAQTEGLSFSVEDKLKIALALDELGVHYIEGGWPGSNPKDIEFFEQVGKERFKNAKMVAFGSTRYKDTPVSEDANLKELVKVDVPVVCIFGKSWDVHATKALVTTLEENLKMIAESVEFLKERDLEVVYDAEHFFDGYRNNRDYALKTIKAAEEAGADFLVLCDTNGGTLPQQVREVVREVKEVVKTPLGIHAHNDAECAVANSLVAVEEGAVQVQGTINGYGERCGNANLTSIIPNLVLKMGLPCLDKKKLQLLTEVSHRVSEIANVVPNPHQPYTGESAFAHKGGVHVSAVLKQSSTYQHVDPTAVGNIQRMLVSELSGSKALLHKAKEAGVDLSGKPQKVTDILKKLKKLEHAGYHFEAADGSFAIFLKKATGAYRPLFKLESFRVIMDRYRSGGLDTEATVRIWIKGKRIVETAEGNGPVHALDRALRKAVGRAYPDLAKIKLTDYKVRIVDEKKGTAAVTRVLIESSDGKRTWGTIGVSENIIEASWEALLDSLEFGLMK